MIHNVPSLDSFIQPPKSALMSKANEVWGFGKLLDPYMSHNISNPILNDTLC
jgi:hypothetical protein